MSTDPDPRLLDKALRSFWHPVAWAEDVAADPVGTELLGEALVLWRTDAAIMAALDRCPHRGTKLSLGEVVDGDVVCPYHGWRYGPNGACRFIPQLATESSIPSRAALEMVRCAERYGIVWAALEEPVAMIPDFPEWEDPDYAHVACRAYTWSASPGRMLENFTDFGHLGYLHDGLLGMRDDLVVPEHKVQADGLTLTYELSMAVPNTNDRFAITDVESDAGLQTNSYVLTLPFSIHLRCRYEDSGTYRTLFFAVQPRSSGESTGYCYQSRNFDLDADPGPFADFQELLAEQDRPIVESQTPKEIPLGATDELHLGFDRVAIVYRRQLRRLLAEVTSSP
jgi:vanillate O-demethylase monooxygenase subunit